MVTTLVPRRPFEQVALLTIAFSPPEGTETPIRFGARSSLPLPGRRCRNGQSHGHTI